jgi:hypothetical protein
MPTLEDLLIHYTIILQAPCQCCLAFPRFHDDRLSSLPAELLVDIFLILAREARETYIHSLKNPAEHFNSDALLPCPYSWIFVTHVSRVWRWVALSTSSL